jgi:predicted ATPase/transcriptional regulator with XRE-family HTH domain
MATTVTRRVFMSAPSKIIAFISSSIKHKEQWFVVSLDSPSTHPKLIHTRRPGAWYNIFSISINLNDNFRSQLFSDSMDREMNTSGTKATHYSSEDEDLPLHFGEWLKRRRQELDLTQEQLAKRVSCSVFAIRKMESGERHPSRQMARMMAQSLDIPCDDHDNFIKAARGELSLERLAALTPAPASETRQDAQPSAPATNLPRAMTPFIGREPELAALGQLLQDPQCSLITILGPGGIGKTRLAVEVARQNQDLFPNGVWFVSLAPLNAPDLIVPTIAEAVGFKFSTPNNQQAQLLRHLCNQKALLILDNAEHLLEGAGLLADILQACAGIKLLVTSRERLNLMSEWTFEITGLPVPSDEQAEQFESYSSVALFLQSARRVRAGFELQAEERPWVQKICHIMAGMPLGIELSAAWVGLLSCEEIAREIERNIDFLTVSMRDLPERHRSLRATVDHSWKLLNGDEQAILRSLSVFQGPFSREAAEEICGANFTVLSSLRNKTLLYRTEPDLFHLHEFIRQYAEHKLAEDPGEQARVKDRHSIYYVQRLAEWEQALKSFRQVETMDEMAQVIDNLALGWQRMVTRCQPGNRKSNPFCADLLHRALFSLSLFYEIRCRSWEAFTIFTESVEYLKSVQEAFGKTEDRCSFTSVLGHISAYLGLHHYYNLQLQQARAYLEEAIQLLEQSQSSVERAQAKVMLASVHAQQGRYQKSVELHEQAQGVFKEAGDNWWYLVSLINLARVYLRIGKLTEAEALCQKGFQSVETGDLRLELPLRNVFAFARYLQHDYVLAEQLTLDNLELAYRWKDCRTTARIYGELSMIMLDTNRGESAVKYIQESIKLLSAFGESSDLAHSLIQEGKCFLVRSELEAARQTFQRVIKIGQTLDIFHFVFWGLVNISRSYLLEDQVEKAVEIWRVLQYRPVEYKLVVDEGICLQADLKARLPKDQFEAAMRQGNGGTSFDRAEADALAYVLDYNGTE